MITLPIELNNDNDLDNALNYFYSKEVQNTDMKHLRFGQFIFNTYNVEYLNSYNCKDTFLVYGRFLEYLRLLNNYLSFKKALEDNVVSLPKHLCQ